MSDDKSTGNPIFDIWLNNQEQFLNAQQQWLKPGAMPGAKIPNSNPFINADFLDRSMQSWQQCEQQYKHWMKAAENWVGGSDKDATPEEDYSAQALTHMLNPTTFMQSGFEMMDQVFSKLVNGPEFADIGMLENKVMKTGQDFQDFREASHRYQEVISSAWLRAYQHFSDEFFDRLSNEDVSSEETLQRWLKIADEEMVSTLRSQEFLDAQRELFATGTASKIKYREFAELWCEAHTIPTRSEVDDLHKIIHELRREVRAMKRQLSKQGAAEPVAQAVAKKTAPAAKAEKKAAKKKAPAKKAPRIKTESKTPPVKRATDIKTPEIKVDAKQAPAKKAPVKKARAKKAPVKKTPVITVGKPADKK